MCKRYLHSTGLILLSVWLTVSCKSLMAQGISGPVGAESWITGGTSAAQINTWSGLNNPATLAFQHTHNLGIYTEQRFMMNEQRIASISGHYKTRWITAGAHIHQYGYDLFNQQRLGITFGRLLTEDFSLGMGIEYVVTNISEYGNEGAAVATLGAYFKANDKLSLGVYVFNPTRSRYALALSDPIPTFARAGITYLLASRIKLCIEAEQQLNQSPVWRGGIRYQLHDRIELGIGGASNPTYLTAGCRMQVRKLKFELASSFHQVLGLTPHLALSIPLTKTQHAKL
ncbi:MAG: hypothetical protein ACK4Y6_03370 [Bacteroidota bacterium]